MSVGRYFFVGTKLADPKVGPVVPQICGAYSRTSFNSGASHSLNTSASHSTLSAIRNRHRHEISARQPFGFDITLYSSLLRSVGMVHLCDVRHHATLT